MFLFPTKCCITRVYKRELNKSAAPVSFISIDTVNIFANPYDIYSDFSRLQKRKESFDILWKIYISSCNRVT